MKMVMVGRGGVVFVSPVNEAIGFLYVIAISGA